MDISSLPKERIEKETKKVFEFAQKPSIYFKCLDSIDKLGKIFPEVKALQGIPQDPKYHPEGNAYIHTLQVLDRAVGLKDRTSNPVG